MKAGIDNIERAGFQSQQRGEKFNACPDIYRENKNWRERWEAGWIEGAELAQDQKRAAALACLNPQNPISVRYPVGVAFKLHGEKVIVTRSEEKPVWEAGKESSVPSVVVGYWDRNGIWNFAGFTGPEIAALKPITA